MKAAFNPTAGQSNTDSRAAAARAVHDDSPASWALLMPLLSSVHTEVLLFAAEALHHKVARQWGGLPTAHRSAVFSALWGLVRGGALPHVAVLRNVATALASAIALSGQQLASTVSEMCALSQQVLVSLASVDLRSSDTLPPLPAVEYNALLGCLMTLHSIVGSVQDCDMPSAAREAAEAALVQAAPTVLALLQGVAGTQNSPFGTDVLQGLLSTEACLQDGCAPTAPTSLQGGQGGPQNWTPRHTAARCTQGATVLLETLMQWCACSACSWEGLVAEHSQLATAVLACLRLPAPALAQGAADTLGFLMDMSCSVGDLSNGTADASSAALVAAASAVHAAVARHLARHGGEAPDIGDGVAACGSAVARAMTVFTTTYQSWIMGRNAAAGMEEVIEAAVAAGADSAQFRTRETAPLPEGHSHGTAFVNATLHLMGSPCLAVAAAACDIAPEFSCSSPLRARPPLLQEHLYAQLLHITIVQAAYPKSFDKEGGWANVTPEPPALPDGLFLDGTHNGQGTHPMNTSDSTAVAVSPEAFHRFRNEAIVGSLIYDVFSLLKAPKFVRVALTSAVLSASRSSSGQRLPPSYAGVDDASWSQVVASLSPDTLLAHWRELEAAFFVLNAVGAQLSSALQQESVQSVAVPVLLPVLRSDIATLPAPLARTLFRLLNYLKRWLASADAQHGAATASGAGGFTITADGVLSAAVRCCLRGCLVAPDGEDEDEEGEAPGEEGGGAGDAVYASADTVRDGSMVCAAAAHSLQGLLTVAAGPLLSLGVGGDLCATLQQMVMHEQPATACVSAYCGLGSLVAHLAPRNAAAARTLLQEGLTPLLEAMQGPLAATGPGELLDRDDQAALLSQLGMLRALLSRSKPIAAPASGRGGALTPLTSAFDAVWPLLQHIFTAQSADEMLVSGACSVLKVFLLCMRWRLLPALPQVCSHMARLAGKHGSAAPLRMLHVLVEVFAGPALHAEPSDDDIERAHSTLHEAVFAALFACTPLRVEMSSEERPLGEAAAALGEIVLVMLPHLATRPVGPELITAAQGGFPNVRLPNGGVPPALRPFMERPSCILDLLLHLSSTCVGQHDVEASRQVAKLAIAACRAAASPGQAAIAGSLADNGLQLLLSFLRALLQSGAQLTHVKLSEAAAHLAAALGVRSVAPAVTQTLLAARGAAVEAGASFGRLTEEDLLGVVQCWREGAARGGGLRHSMGLLRLLSEVVRGQEDREALLSLGLQ